ncbi:MAG: hypothetical protein GY866_10145 [Proteobacteria bacterium]|nr:hypothetical protein [Pseudomonadota bacterium]
MLQPYIDSSPFQLLVLLVRSGMILMSDGSRRQVKKEECLPKSTGQSHGKSPSFVIPANAGMTAKAELIRHSHAIALPKSKEEIDRMIQVLLTQTSPSTRAAWKLKPTTLSSILEKP